MSANPGVPRGRSRRGARPGAGAGGGSGSRGPDAGPRPGGVANTGVGPWETPASAGPGGGRYRRSVLEAAILTSLVDSDSHGYDLVEQIGSLASSLVCVDSGTMYRMLRGMEQEGLVTSTWQTPEAGPSRRVYAITAEGIEALEVMAQSLSQRAAAMQQLADMAFRVVKGSRQADE